MDEASVIPERVEVTELGGDHPVQFAYYGGVSDGRLSRMGVMFEGELTTIMDGATTFDYQVTRYGVHSDSSLCWVLFMHTPIAERGKL